MNDLQTPMTMQEIVTGASILVRSCLAFVTGLIGTAMCDNPPLHSAHQVSDDARQCSINTTLMLTSFFWDASPVWAVREVVYKGLLTWVARPCAVRVCSKQ